MRDMKVFAKSILKLASDNSPAILTAVAVAGVVTTTVLAVRGTAPAIRDIQQAQSEQVDELTLKDKIRLSWQYYVPALGVGAATIACIVGANSVSNRRNAALVSLYSVTETAFKEYKDKVVEVVGENKETSIRDGIAQDIIDSKPLTGREVVITGDGSVLCYDTLSGRYFDSSVETIRKAQNDINAIIINNGYADLNEFYHEIGLPSTDMGGDVGWNSDKLIDISFSGTIASDSRPCIALDYSVRPTKGYYRFH